MQYKKNHARYFCYWFCFKPSQKIAVRFILHFDNEGTISWSMINCRSHFLTFLNNAIETTRSRCLNTQKSDVTFIYWLIILKLFFSLNLFLTPQNGTRIEKQGKCSVPMSSIPSETARAMKWACYRNGKEISLNISGSDSMS